MANGDSVTHWLGGIRAGQNDEIQRLWDRYFQRLVRLAGSRLPGHGCCAIDEEDVVLSAFQNFCDRARKGQFPGLANRDDLWRGACFFRDHGPKGRQRGAAPDAAETGRRSCTRRIGDRRRRPSRGKSGMAAFLPREPTPADAAEFADRLDLLFKKLYSRRLGDRVPETAGPDLGGDCHFARYLRQDRGPQAPVDPGHLGGGIGYASPADTRARTGGR